MLKYCLIVFQLLAVGLHAQTDSVLVTKNFKFNDGVYRTFSDWRNNSPNWSWDSLNVVSATNPNTFLTQVEYIRFADGRPMHLDSIWGLVISGIPYVRLPKGAVTKPLTSFAGLRVRGLIGYYNYEVVEEEMVEIQAYNPVTGVPFGWSWPDSSAESTGFRSEAKIWMMNSTTNSATVVHTTRDTVL